VVGITGVRLGCPVSGHDIGAGFAKDNGGAIPPNLLQIPNTESNGVYVSACKVVDAKQHPARFPAKLPEFFIRMLTQPGDVVLDIFGGSNTTGQVAEAESRRWLTFELSREYVAASSFRFIDKGLTEQEISALHYAVADADGPTVDMSRYRRQGSLLAAQ
jgi:DNA modification methylase